MDRVELLPCNLILDPFRGPQIPADGPRRRSKIAATIELLDLNASELDHLRPFFGFIRNQLAELGWSHDHRIGNPPSPLTLRFQIKPSSLLKMRCCFGLLRLMSCANRDTA
jgi:hypothetical protein